MTAERIADDGRGRAASRFHAVIRLAKRKERVLNCA
jgi:hypothetical protein